jgi:hypothetical protein
MAAVIEAARDKPFKLGEHDCFTFVNEVYTAITGTDLRLRLTDYHYCSAFDAMRNIVQYGKSFEEAGDWFFGNRVEITKAQRGDIAAYKGPSGLKHLGVIDHGLLCFTDVGLTRAPLQVAHVAWRTG